MVSGIYEYSVRNFYITFIKAKKTDNEEDMKLFLKKNIIKKKKIIKQVILENLKIKM